MHEVLTDFYQLGPAAFVVEFDAQVALVLLELLEEYDHCFAARRRRVHVLGSHDLEPRLDQYVGD